MSDQSLTPWLRTGSDAAPELRELLGSARVDEPTAAQLEELSVKLAPLLVAGAVGTVAAGSTSTVAVGSATAVKVSVVGSLTAKVVLGTLGAVVAVGGAVQVNRALDARRPPAPLRRELLVPAPAAAPTHPAPVVVAPEVAEPVEAEPVTPVARRVPFPAPEVVTQPPPSAPTDAEVKLLEEAMGALKRGDTASALQLTERHARDFSDGLLVQEREVLAIEALMQAGRVPEARSRADRFKTRFPGSTHLMKVDGLVNQR